MRALGLILTGVAGLGPALVVAVEAAAFTAGTSLVPLLEAAGGSLCHHDPARTLSVGEQLLPVCARCTGLYVGAAAGGLAALRLPLRGDVVRGATRLAGVTTALGLLAAFAEAAGLLSTSNAARVGLGALLGVGLPLFTALGGRLISAARAPATSATR